MSGPWYSVFLLFVSGLCLSSILRFHGNGAWHRFKLIALDTQIFQSGNLGPYSREYLSHSLLLIMFHLVFPFWSPVSDVEYSRLILFIFLHVLFHFLFPTFLEIFSTSMCSSSVELTPFIFSISQFFLVAEYFYYSSCTRYHGA